MSLRYTTSEDLRQYLSNIPTGTATDNILDAIIDRASSIVDTELGFSFDGYTADTTKIVYGTGTPTLTLPPHNQGSITSIVPEGGTAIDASTWTEQADGHIYLNSAYRAYPAPFASDRYYAGWGFYRYTVTGDWGYGDPPDAIVQVTLELAVNMWRSRDKGMWTDVIGVDGSGGIRFIGGLTNQQRDIINGTKRQFTAGLVIA